MRGNHALHFLAAGTQVKFIRDYPFYSCITTLEDEAAHKDSVSYQCMATLKSNVLKCLKPLFHLSLSTSNTRSRILQKDVDANLPV